MTCLDPGFSNSSAEKYGYHVSLYWAGLRTPDLSFIRWNGKENESRSSREILEEMFLLPGNQSIVKVVAYTENYDDTYKADVTFKPFIYPRGRCMIVSPPINRTLSDKTPKRLTVAFRDSFVDQLKLSSAKLKVYLMDKVTSPLQYPDEMEMDGNQIEVPLQSRYYVYRTKISKSEHVLGDPFLTVPFTR